MMTGAQVVRTTSSGAAGDLVAMGGPKGTGPTGTPDGCGAPAAASVSASMYCMFVPQVEGNRKSS